MDHTFTSCLGYAAILTGCLFEGETVLVAAGWAVQSGYLSLPLVLLSAWLGAVSGDHLFFMLGRYKGSSVFGLFPSWSPKIEKALGLVEKYGNPLIFGARFLYGFRTVAPFAVGTTRIGIGRFVFLDLLSGWTWTMLYGLAGYLFGAAIGRLLIDARFLTALSVVLLGCITLVIYRRSIMRETSRVAKNVQVYFGAAGRLLRTLRLSHGT